MSRTPTTGPRCGSVCPDDPALTCLRRRGHGGHCRGANVHSRKGRAAWSAAPADIDTDTDTAPAAGVAP